MRKGRQLSSSGVHGPMCLLGAAWIGIIVVGMSFAVIVRAQEPGTSQPATQIASRPAIRFAFVNVYIDSKAQPLAAYQFELAAEVGEIKIVGIEGGEHAAFKEPPYYDPAALYNDRIIIAAFDTGRDLPKGKTRVARVHVQITGQADPQYVVKLHVAASDEGKPIANATISLAQGEAR